ncbi:hypothetical protein P7K49_031468 [Saguinus oedipus]|uniref:Uncharacterized protein n=1 Tax=Saguinus oedipus TaxID=9490 RepID=A0ABQ9TZH6_SAGOE|nr:hypothetical protein P7K49_031468 [Saguinus oedipus]
MKYFETIYLILTVENCHNIGYYKPFTAENEYQFKYRQCEASNEEGGYDSEESQHKDSEAQEISDVKTRGVQSSSDVSRSWDEVFKPCAIELEKKKTVAMFMASTSHHNPVPRKNSSVFYIGCCLI